jgi:dienelactone hydrolase
MIIGGTMPRVLTGASLLAVLCLIAQPPTGAQEPPVPPARGERGVSAPAVQDDRAREIDQKLDEIRKLLEHQKAELDEQRRQLNAIQNYLTNAPGIEVQNEDYPQARARFQTKLLRNGPPPDRGSPDLKPPSGVTEVVYPSGPLRLKAWVNRPADESRKLPAVLFLHGGWEFTRGDWEQSKPYRDAGFVVLTPMLRGENGQAGFFTYFYDEVDDVLAAAEYLGEQPYVDPNRLFVAGHSVGGTMTLLAALASRRFRAAASFSGAPFWPEFAESKNLPFDRNVPREIQLRSPIAYAGSFTCPLRMYYGTGEDGFFGLMSRRTAALAKKRGLDVEARAIEGDHGSHVERAMMQSIAFFKKNDLQVRAGRDGEIVSLPATLELSRSP